ncbi:MAG: hypothetical protein Q4G68_10555 [Planctomycetia bacterium]|nr:hypothetical protein [Planctomycetia bacterium]
MQGNLYRGYVGLFVMMTVCWFGCSAGDRPADLPDLYKIRIKLTQEGQPVEGALVNFVARSPLKWAVGGVSDASGICQPRTHGKFNGVPEGSYDITVRKICSEPTGNMVPGAMPGTETPEVKNTQVIDEKYTVPGALTLDVVPGGQTEFAFELGAPVTQSADFMPPGKKK